MSQGLGAWIAQIAFWVLLIRGISYRELSKKLAAIFLALWLAGYLGPPRISSFSGALVTPYIAVLDIVLVVLVFKGDVRLT